MSKVVVVTLGFEEKFIVRALVRRGLEVGDLVVAFTGPIIDKVRRAIEYLRGFLRYFEGVEFRIIEVSEVYDFIEAIFRVKYVLTDLLSKYEYMYVSLSGGMRALVIEVLTATYLLPEELKSRVFVELDTEDGKAVVSLPKELLLLLKIPELGVKKRVLSEIVKCGEVDIYTLAQRLGKDVTTLRRQVEALKSLGLVELTYRPLRIKAKPIAKLLT